MEDELKAKWPGLGLDMDVSSDWGARKAATGGRQEHYK
jgi:hypothetical protein